ncbi:D-xylose reductase IIIII [Fusarium albosuccineum]|uniref:D-xylose reductase IIIII n=1 Tax=Fusarium albosuccineum TaxID=1237068 RepID=A0A8H4LAL9_9HYPO|nr:D-xylose reductase IIIII [Fusarium albosuccineum]
MAAKLAKDLSLKGSSTTLPKLVYGTAWKKEQSAGLVYTALKNGFRGVDTAGQPKHYNEKGVGEGVQRAIKDGLITRDALFIQTKFSPPGNQDENAPYDLDAPLVDKVHQSVQSSLAYFTIEGQEPYLDSVLLHSPLRTIQETLTAWETLETYVPHKIRNLGISNTTLPILQALNEAATIKPSVVQNRFYRDTAFETELRAYCREQGIVFQTFWTLSANPRLAASKPIKVVAEKAGVPHVPAYYALVLGLESVTVLDGTSTETHMKDDVEGTQKVASWAESDGASDWASALAEFKQAIGEA